MNASLSIEIFDTPEKNMLSDQIYVRVFFVLSVCMQWHDPYVDFALLNVLNYRVQL